ncbi:methylated-DNA--[protein]-cysteine S-methyltransferase [Alteromonas sp. ASW11-36]|uniref:Methylated-DNA--protein-cysteine methyltransferase n=1 Tax=Alteromonas arenosi TaxID=3055817 RepID=A0ABT7T2Z4_9ALTE|nr:methylated-DNA--[protein]-cysteine S-methyltransferase [Alteromonas sp. ASW11-36]MDM7862172.1 methylated-DNA--[protein]-cysteine S-methyltransferase [Alteromonas sp. ASW11-36]
MAIDYLTTPIGLLAISANQNGMTEIVFVDEPSAAVKPNNHTQAAKAQLQEYFDGERQTFDLALSAQGTTFQQQVWQALLSIPYGSTASYLDIATQIGNLNACRAVGAANGKNPLGIVVPCHRVIGSNGTLTGYAGGIERKQWLLSLEQGQQLDLLT